MSTIARLRVGRATEWSRLTLVLLHRYQFRNRSLEDADITEKADPVNFRRFSVGLIPEKGVIPVEETS